MQLFVRSRQTLTDVLLFPLDLQRRLQAIVAYRTVFCEWHFYRQIYRQFHLICQSLTPRPKNGYSRRAFADRPSDGAPSPACSGSEKPPLNSRRSRRRTRLLRPPARFCSSKRVSPAIEQVDNSWMDRLIGTVERVWSASRKPGGHVQGTLVRAVRDFASTNLRFAVWARCTLQCYRLINDK